MKRCVSCKTTGQEVYAINLKPCMYHVKLLARRFKHEQVLTPVSCKTTGEEVYAIDLKRWTGFNLVVFDTVFSPWENIQYFALFSCQGCPSL